MNVIYAIKNSVSGRAYVGSTVNARVRKQTHFRALRKGSHHCIHLQHSWNKYGEGAFTFTEIGVAENVVELREIEQAFLDAFFGVDLYNSNKSAVGMAGGDSHPAKSDSWHQKHVMQTMTELERKEKFGKSSRGVKRDHETYSAGAKKQWADPEHRQKRMQAMRGKREIVTCPHCLKVGGGGNMRRYHFDKCKSAGK